MSSVERFRVGPRLRRLRYRLRMGLWEALHGARPYQTLGLAALPIGLLAAALGTAPALWASGGLWVAVLLGTRPAHPGGHPADSGRFPADAEGTRELSKETGNCRRRRR